MREEAKESWASGEFTDDSHPLEKVALINISAVEKIKTLDSIIFMDYEDYESQMKAIDGQ